MNREEKIQSLYDSFSIKLRTEMIWDKEIFSQLLNEMKLFCAESSCDTNVDRKTAGVFWCASWWVRQQISGVSSFAEEYYENAIINLDHLAWWLFENESRSDGDFEPM